MKKWGVIGRVSLMKNQHIVILFIAALLLVSWPVTTFAAQEVTVMFEDVKLNSDVSPVLDGDRVLVPLRAIFEALGARVEWDQETHTVTAITRRNFLQLSVGEKRAFLNGNEVDLDVPAKIINGHTMVPVRFVSQALGASVDWRVKSRTVVIQNAPIHYLKVQAASGQSAIVLPDGWAVSYIHNEDSSGGFRRDLYRITPDGKENLSVVEDVPLNYAWNPAGESLVIDQDVLAYGAGTANPSGTWVKELASRRETLISYPSGVMGSFVEPVWLDDNKLMTSRGTAAPEARAIVVDTDSGESLQELPPGFRPLGTLGDDFLGVLRERENWDVAHLSLWEPNTGTLVPILSLENATNFSLDSTKRSVAWLDSSDSKRLDGSPYNVQQVKTYHFESDLLQTYPVQGLITSGNIADAVRGQLQTHSVWGHEVSWSPDGRYLVVSAGNILQVLEVTSGEITQLDDYNQYPLGSFAWRPDSTELVWEKKVSDEDGGQRIELWRWHVEGGEVGPLFTPEHFFNREPVWSPDGTSLVYAAGDKETTRLYLWDVQTNTNHPLTLEEPGVTVTDPRWVSYKP